VSTILDALRRLESDRRRREASERSHTNGLGDEPGFGSTTRRVPPWLLGAGIGLAVVGVAAVVFFGLRPGAGDATSDAGPAPVAAAIPNGATEPAARSAAQRATNSAPTPRAESGPDAERTTIRSAVPLAPPPPPRAQAQVPPPSPVPQTWPDPAVRPVAELPVAAPAPEAAAAPVARRSESRSVVDPAPPAEPTEQQLAARSLAESLSDPGFGRGTASFPEPAAVAQKPESGQTAAVAESRSDAPTDEVALAVDRAAEVSIVRTIWHPSPDRRIAHLRIAGESTNREVHEGDLVEGYEIDEIKLTGVVLVREGVTFERRVTAKQAR
jgi:hypothetical protein